jgi:uncharacterized membrane protein
MITERDEYLDELYDEMEVLVAKELQEILLYFKDEFGIQIKDTMSLLEVWLGKQQIME